MLKVKYKRNIKYKRTDALSVWHNNRAPRWTFPDPCKPEVRPGAREESASLAWLAAPAMNARDTAKVYIWRLDTGCGPTIYRKCRTQITKVDLFHSKMMKLLIEYTH